MQKMQNYLKKTNKQNNESKTEKKNITKTRIGMLVQGKLRRRKLLLFTKYTQVNTLLYIADIYMYPYILKRNKTLFV